MHSNATYRWPVLVCSTLGLAAALGCSDSHQGPDATANTKRLTWAQTITDGVGLQRDVSFATVIELNDNQTRYEATVDGQPRTLEVTELANGAARRIRVYGDAPAQDIELIHTADEVLFGIAGQVVGVRPIVISQSATFVTHRESDPLSFALLSFFPHTLAGLRPGDLFREPEVAGTASFAILNDVLGVLVPKRMTCTKGPVSNSKECRETCATEDPAEDEGSDVSGGALGLFGGKCKSPCSKCNGVCCSNCVTVDTTQNQTYEVVFEDDE